jgi:hypothetical protein
VNRRAGAPGSEKTIARVKKSYRLGFAAYLLATIAAIFWPYIGVAICFSLWPLWALLHYYDREFYSAPAKSAAANSD